jgi:Cu-Zn family superoxide dismutase
MKRSTITSIIVILTVSSSLAHAMTRRHDSWDGLVVGKNGSKIRGAGSMAAGKAGGTTLAEVKYKGDRAGAVRPWHVHVGSCAKGGPILGDASAYSALRVAATGDAEGKATLRLALPDSGSYFVNIHESPTKMGTIVACGDLLFGTN